MIAWLPDKHGHPCDLSCLAVYKHGEPKPNLGQMNSWEWDGKLVKATLHPSVKRTIKLTVGGEREVFHGFLQRGIWTPC